jgi:hypothetical protein
MQGFLFAHPQPGTAIEALLKSGGRQRPSGTEAATGEFAAPAL